MDIKVDVTGVRLETGRLILRPFEKADLEDFFAYASVPGVGEMAGWPHHESIETSKTIMDLFIEEKNVLAIVHKADQRVIGSVGLHGSWAHEVEKYNDLKIKEIGYVLAKPYWGQGLMPEAVKAVMAYGFKKLGLDAFTCCHFTENQQSKRVIEKCGFEFMQKDSFNAKQLGCVLEECQYLCKRKRIEVAAAVIIENGRVFATQRGDGPFKDGWEFPGGKLEKGEQPEEALKREIREELNTVVEVLNPIYTVEYDYPEFHLTMHCYRCAIQEGNLELLEHEAAKWLSVEELYSINWLPADIDLIPHIEDELKRI